MDRSPTAPPLHAAETDLTARQAPPPPWVVGIGAGAGGLEAIQLLFGAMPVDAGIAFIICRHVQSGLSDPLADLLCTQTAMPVVQAANDTLLEAGNIYLVPPDARMILLRDRLVPLGDSDDMAENQVSPIDLLLHSLAVSAGPAAMAVMLSGKDEDGLRGCASVREHGGIVLAQHPDSTEFAEMPRRVIAARLATAVAPPGALADLIWRRVGEAHKVNLKVHDSERDDEALARIAKLLAERFAIDAHAYRPSLVAKRIRRRLTMARATSLSDYADRLADDDNELAALHDDLLIRVTTFFRDPEAFAVLDQNVIATLVERMSEEHPIRVWVPACATGEEPYSIAMMFLDRAARTGKAAHVDIIASDRHVPAIKHGCDGRYTRDRLGHVPKDLVAAFTEPDGDGFVISPSLRNHVTFVEHDLLNASPPDDIDLVSCRNLLIYLSTQSRKKALLACRDALKPGGFLFLGPSEQPGSQMAGLETIHGKWRLYRKANELPVGDALSRLVEATRQKPAEPITPIEPKTANTADFVDPLSQPPASASDPSDPSDLMENQRMLESTIDTLLSSNDRLRRRNQNLRAENQRLLEAHAALDDVATMIAHDLKMPLGALESLTEHLHAALDTSQDAGEAHRWVQPIQHRLGAINQIIDDLLDYAREAPPDKADLRPVDFADMLRETLTLIGLPKGIRVVIKPPALRIVTSRIPLACIFRSLLGQAVERIGGASGTIRIDAKTQDNRLDVTIVDNGRSVGGRGVGDHPADLGLAIVRQFLKTSGGKLTASANASGAGHQVDFTWPIKETSERERARQARSTA